VAKAEETTRAIEEDSKRALSFKRCRRKAYLWVGKPRWVLAITLPHTRYKSAPPFLARECVDSRGTAAKGVFVSSALARPQLHHLNETNLKNMLNSRSRLKLLKSSGSGYSSIFAANTGWLDELFEQPFQKDERERIIKWPA
jgi:hypothetical protein